MRSEYDRDVAESLSWRQVSLFRLRRHHLDQRAPPGSLISVAGDMCGVQAQVMPAAQMALWARVQNITKEDIERSLREDRTLVKTWCMRRTVHLVPSDELPVYLAALSHGMLEGERKWAAKHGLSLNETDQMINSIVNVLAVGPMTRRELTDAVASSLGDKARKWIEGGWGGVVKQACLRGLVCFGPNRGQEVTFCQREQWLPHFFELPREKAEAQLLRHYLHSYGPASLGDFAVWSGMTVKESTPILNRLVEDVSPVSVEGNQKWMLTKDLADIQRERHGAAGIRLLPSFDVYMLGHKDKTPLIDQEHYKRVYRKAGWLSPVVVADGHVIGTWTHELRGSLITIVVEPFSRISAEVRHRIEEEAEDLARFYESECKVRII